MKIFKDGIFANIASHTSLFSQNKSLVEIFLLSSSLGANIPLVQLNNDIREYCCENKVDWSIKNLSSTVNIGKENTHCYVIKFNTGISSNVADDLIYKLACHLGLKYKCVQCAYHYRDKERKISLHYD
tara:strand:+ start:48 stop:431 length:384 start_codon:yes stop_codon:yes gene_type:complete